jgi:hypothetical protein
MALPKKPRRSPAEGDLPFEYDWEPAEEVLTAYAGIPLLVRAARSLGVPASVKRYLEVKQRQRGPDEASYVESFLVLNALGGECLDDFERLREDQGLAEMLGHALPSPGAARDFLNAFHDQERIAQAQRELPAGQVSYIPSESAPLRALAQVNQDLVQEIGRRCAEQKIATVDLDATIIESFKREAKPTYEGGKGYQPLLALWAEMDLALADEFRDGNVPAHAAPLPTTQRAFAALPGSVTEFYFRGDSGSDHLRDQRAHDAQSEETHSAVAGCSLEGLPGGPRGGERVCGPDQLLARGRGAAGRSGAAALRGHPDKEAARGAVQRWC